MKINSLELDNIRSYVSERVDFPEGVVLLEGDIGSGKSTVLYAIEFALFGLGDLNSSFLLRNSAAAGRVLLEFSVNERKCIVERTLERKKIGVQQGNGFLQIDGVKTEYAPTELKAAVLKLLEFNEPVSSKGQSVIYRYAVFTPQEEMKEILNEKPLERLETLRKAFGIEEYERARENSLLVVKQLREQERFIEGRVSELAALESSLEQKQKDLVVLEQEFAVVSVACVSSQTAFDSSRVAWDELRSRKEEFEKLLSEVPLLATQLKEKQELAKRVNEQLIDFRKELSSDEAALSLIKVASVDTRSLEASVLENRKAQRVLVAVLAGITAKKNNFDELKAKGVCPTCQQPFTDSFTGRVEHLLVEEKDASAKLSVLEEKEKELSASLDSLKQSVMQANLAADLRKRVEKTTRTIAGLVADEAAVAAALPLLSAGIEEKQSRLKELNQVSVKMLEAEKAFKQADVALKDALTKKSSVQSRLETSKVVLNELREKISGLKKELLTLATLRERKSWLQDYFAPSMQLIESHVMQSIASDFNELFQKWFSVLMDSSELAVSSNQSFEPLVSISGYEQSYQTLSGGEKSALALAYRLALNSVVRKVYSSMRENLLILDEPTDGFSKEQLQKMSRVFQTIECDQLLIVSHERELEAFADAVLRVEKRGSVSTIIK